MSSNQLVEVFEGLTEEGGLVYRCRGRSAPDLSSLATKLGVPFDRLCPRPDPELRPAAAICPHPNPKAARTRLTQTAADEPADRP
ncbi:MAG TPA: hypothetical protein VHU15_09750, partial [Stellaceae bacterium]|nr:hypothetical protein [Stellaceae bacterium]